MAPNETSALLKNYHCDHQQYTNDDSSNNNVIVGNNHNDADVSGYHTLDDNNHVVYINKDASEYEPIFCINEYSYALTLDELLPYKLDPWWQNLRRILFLTTWLIVLVTFLTGCLLAYLEAGLTTCNMLTTANIELTTSSTSGILAAAATTTLPTTIAKILSTELLGGGGVIAP
ncbi:uncharacterized protein ACRADG_012804 [Cochliomyia hominivorax]